MSSTSKNPVRNPPWLHECSITIVGHWNRMIFTPKWVGERVFAGTGEAVKAQVPLMPADPIVYSTSAVSLTVSASQLIFKVLMTHDKGMTQAERMACIVVNELDDTPILGIDIHMKISGLRIPKEMDQFFSGTDMQRLEHFGWRRDVDSMFRFVVKDQRRLWFNITRHPLGAFAGFYFHFDVDDSQKAIATMKGHLLAYRDEAVEILRRGYRIDMGQMS